MNETSENSTRVSRITIGRLHSLGNYEHVRYEIAVDIGQSDNPAVILNELETILNDLQADSGVSEYDIKKARNALNKPATELDKWDIANLETYKKQIEKVDETMERRAKARAALATLGGTSKYTDAKDKWDDD